VFGSIFSFLAFICLLQVLGAKDVAIGSFWFFAFIIVGICAIPFWAWARMHWGTSSSYPVASNLINTPTAPTTAQKTSTSKYTLPTKFDHDAHDFVLRYKYNDVHIVGSQYRDQDAVSSLALNDVLIAHQEPDNPHDSRAIYFTKNYEEVNIGYMKKESILQDMANDYIAGGGIVVGMITDVDKLNVLLGFYKEGALESGVDGKVYKLTGTKEEFQDNRAMLIPGEQVSIHDDFDSESGRGIVTAGFDYSITGLGKDIGYLSARHMEDINIENRAAYVYEVEKVNKDDEEGDEYVEDKYTASIIVPF